MQPVYGSNQINSPATLKDWPCSTLAALMNCKSTNAQAKGRPKSSENSACQTGRCWKSCTNSGRTTQSCHSWTWPKTQPNRAHELPHFLVFKVGPKLLFYIFIYTTILREDEFLCAVGNLVLKAVQWAPWWDCLSSGWWLPHELKWEMSGQRENCLFKSSPDNTALLRFMGANARGTPQG